MGQLLGKSRHKSSSSFSSSSSSFSPPSKNTIYREQQIKQQQVSEKDWATLELKRARDRLKKYRKRLEIESTKLTEQAKEHIRAQQRNRAMLILKLRKHKEKTAEEIDNQLITILQQIEDLEWTAISVQVLNAIKTGNNLLNKIHEEMSVEDVQSLLDETNEAIEIENQINTLLAGSISSIEESDLLEELDKLTDDSTTLFIENNNNIPTHSATTITTITTAVVVSDKKEIDLPEVPKGDINILPVVPQHEIIAPVTVSSVQDVEKEVLA